MLMLNKINKIDSIIELEKAYAVTILELKTIQEEYDKLKAKNLALEQEIALLKEQLLLAGKHRFGSKSEANLGEDIISQDTTLVIPSHTRKKPSKKNGRIIDLSGLPRYKHYYDLDEAHKNCPQCSKVLTRIGEDVREQLEIIPMHLYVVEQTRYKYACKPCNTIIMAPKPLSPIPKALAGGSLLSEVIVNKFQYHLPLYRQAKMFASINAVIPDNTLGNWVMQAGDLLLPYIGEALWQAVLKVKYLQADETPIKLLKPNKKGYIWTYFALHQRLVVFEVAETRKGEIAENRLANFKGLLQTDGYAGYKNLRARKDIVGFGCLSHARRKFADVLKITKNNTGIAAEFINKIKPLYSLEAKMKELACSFHTRKRLRQKQALPIFKELHAWLKQQKPKVPPNSKLGQAINYTLTQWKYIAAYLSHGMAEIDTNYIENEIRPIAIGKKNWMFMESITSGAINAFWYSIVASALLNGLNPRTYIHFLLMKVHDLRQGKIDAFTLLPHVIDKKLLIDFAAQQIAIGKKIFDSS